MSGTHAPVLRRNLYAHGSRHPYWKAAFADAYELSRPVHPERLRPPNPEPMQHRDLSLKFWRRKEEPRRSGLSEPETNYKLSVPPLRVPPVDLSVTIYKSSRLPDPPRISGLSEKLWR